MIGEILSLIPTIVGMFNSNDNYDEYINEMNKIRDDQRVSESARRAEAMYREKAAQGLPGYETMKEDIRSRLPETIGAAQDWLTSGQAIDFLGRASTDTNRQLEALRMKNEAAKEINYGNLAKYLGEDMTRQENLVKAAQNQFGVQAAYGNLVKGDAANKYMFQIGNSLAGITDKDLSAFIAGLSGKEDSLDLTTGVDHNSLGIPAGQSSTILDYLKPTSPSSTDEEKWKLLQDYLTTTGQTI